MQGPATMMTDKNQGYKTGELLVKEGLICDEDVSTALAIQEKRAASVSLNKKRYLGMILCDLNLITPIDNYVVLHKHNKLISLSTALVQKQVVTLDQMQSIEAQSLREDLPLISLLMKGNTVSLQTLQQVLFDLFHIPFRSISDFIFNEKDRPLLGKVIDRQASKEGGIIPLVLKDNTILFGVTAPENLLLIHELNRQFPQYRFKALFIPFSGFTWFHDIVYNGQTIEHPPKAPAADKEIQPDLSLLMAYKARVSDPEVQWLAVQNLYSQYETLRTLLGHFQKGDRQKAFSRFIQDAHDRIVQTGGIGLVEFSFKKQGRDVVIMATPKE